MSGAKLNLRTMVTNPATLVLIPVFFVCFLLAKVAEIFIYKRRFKTINAVAAAALTSTTITLVLPTLEIARNLHAISTAQSGAFTLAAVLTAICSPILFNRLFQPQEEEQIKTRVTFVGTNLLTIPVAQMLPDSQYEICMLTDSEKNYRTYNSEAANVQLIPQMDETALTEAGAFDSDLLVLGYRDGEVNYNLALDAVKHGTPRVIARFERNLESERIDELQAKGVEIFNSYNVNISLLRGLIETPSTLKLLTDTEAGIYEAAVNNRKYTGITLMSLPNIQGITISRIYRQGHFVAPHGDTLIEPGDHLLFTGDRATARQLQRELTRRN